MKLKTVGVVDVLAACQMREGGLAHEASQPMTIVLSSARIGEQTDSHVDQAKGIIEFAM